MPANVPGIHHVTAIARDVQSTVDFYVASLGLRFIKKTVNFDVPDTYHIYFGDQVGTPGTAMTFFGWPHLRWGPAGTGQGTAGSLAIPPGPLHSRGDPRILRDPRRLARLLGAPPRRARRGGIAGAALRHRGHRAQGPRRHRYRAGRRGVSRALGALARTGSGRGRPDPGLPLGGTLGEGGDTHRRLPGRGHGLP